jgi:hypothetical protein
MNPNEEIPHLGTKEESSPTIVIENDELIDDILQLQIVIKGTS